MTFSLFLLSRTFLTFRKLSQNMFLGCPLSCRPKKSSKHEVYQWHQESLQIFWVITFPIIIVIVSTQEVFFLFFFPKPQSETEYLVKVSNVWHFLVEPKSNFVNKLIWRVLPGLVRWMLAQCQQRTAQNC